MMAALGLGSALSTRRLALRPGARQALLEAVLGFIDDQIRETVQRDPAPFRAPIGTIFLYILIANWSSLVPVSSRRPRASRPMPRWR